ncbi:MAG TPA: hypothetical protein VNO86_04660 [Candidatus Binatia bacterium]|nr:hypothetical protein [Candidatus Binatia bacterium]
MRGRLIRAAAAALVAVGLVLSSGALAERHTWAAVEPEGFIVLAFEEGCQGTGTIEGVNETLGRLAFTQPVSWSADAPIAVTVSGGSGVDVGERLTVRLRSSDGQLLFAAPVSFLDEVIIDQRRLPDYLLLVRLDCSRVPYEISRHLSYNPARPLQPDEPRGRAARPPADISAAITLTFAPGCQGSGTYEVVNETKGVVQRRQATTWSASTPIVVDDGSNGVADRGDRLVVRLRGADGRLLFAAPVQFLGDIIVDQRRPPDYLLLVRLDCARVPYEVTEHLSYAMPAGSPATSTADPAVERESPWSPPVLLVLFGLGLAASARSLVRRRRGSQPVNAPGPSRPEGS